MVMYKRTKMNQTELYVSSHIRRHFVPAVTSNAHPWKNDDTVVYICVMQQTEAVASVLGVCKLGKSWLG